MKNKISSSMYDVVIVGAGFTGLVAGFELSKSGKRVLILEKDNYPGGLAGSFEFSDGVILEKFYHHWFNNDEYVPKIVEELGLSDHITLHDSNTGMFFNGRIWDLSSPLDLMSFKPLSFINRIRLGLVVLGIRLIKDWKKIEHLSIKEWLEPLCGKEAYKVVWEPLVNSKFSIYSEDVSAVWMWKKLVLRGGTRNKNGGEQLAYFKGGFAKLASALSEGIISNGGEVSYGTAVNFAEYDGDIITSLDTSKGAVLSKDFIFTPAFNVIADIFKKSVDAKWLTSIRRIKYLGNMCLVLRLSQSLSDTYWTNVNDPGFPFVGVIEHTNFDSTENYDGSHIVYLSKYLSNCDEAWGFTDIEYLDYCLGYLKSMFPHFNDSWILDFKVWRAEYAQPVTEKSYSSFMPSKETPYKNGYISTMAQIYPEDRGTNYAIREGMQIATLLTNKYC